MLGVIFLFNQFWLIKIIVFNKNFLFSIENIDFLGSNLKRYFTSAVFLLSSGGFRIAKVAIIWTKLCAH